MTGTRRLVAPCFFDEPLPVAKHVDRQLGSDMTEREYIDVLILRGLRDGDTPTQIAIGSGINRAQLSSHLRQMRELMGE